VGLRKTSSMIKIHGSSVEINGQGILLTGPSGAGKSDLALRLVDDGATLVADDYTVVAVDGGQVMISPPREIAGKLEVRGLGIIKLPFTEKAPLRAVFELVNYRDIERMPEDTTVILDGVMVPQYRIDPFTASAAAIIRRALDKDGMGIT